MKRSNHWMKALDKSFHGWTPTKFNNSTPDEIINLFRMVRWPESNGHPICPRCSSPKHDTAKFQARESYHCKVCGDSYSLTTGTVLYLFKFSLKETLLGLNLFTLYGEEEGLAKFLVNTRQPVMARNFFKCLAYESTHQLRHRRYPAIAEYDDFWRDVFNLVYDELDKLDLTLFRYQQSARVSYKKREDIKRKIQVGENYLTYALSPTHPNFSRTSDIAPAEPSRLNSARGPQSTVLNASSKAPW